MADQGEFDDEPEYDPLEGNIVSNAEAETVLHPPRREGWAS